MSDSGYDALMQELLQMFAVEAAEHIQTLSRTLLKLEQHPQSSEQQDWLNAAFRAAHSLKGSARAVELADIERIAHEAESVLSAARAGKLALNSDIIDILLQANDTIESMVGGAQPDEATLNMLQSQLADAAQGKPIKPAPDPPPAEADKPSGAAPPPVSSVSVTPSPGESSLDALMQELLQMFAVEAEEHIGTLSSSLLRLEKDPPAAERAELLNAAFRAAHNLKGSARAVELLDIEGVAHEAESVLSAARAGKLTLNADVVDVLLRANDTIQAMVTGETVQAATLDALKSELQALETSAPAPPTPEPPPREEPAAPPEAAISQPDTTGADAVPLTNWQAEEIDKSKQQRRAPIKPSALSTGASEETIRVSVEKLDDLMAQAGELIVSKISADERLRELRDLRAMMSRWEKTWTEATELRRDIDRLSREDDGENSAKWEEVLDFLQANQRFFAETLEKTRALDKLMTADNMRMTLVTQAIQEEIRRVRMLPVETLVPTMERVVRDVARASGKKAQLIITGAGVELDKRVLEDLKDPLIHLLRNSVDHGIETSDERADRQKPETGTVIVSITQRGGNVQIIVADDGKGLDAERIRRSSVEKGLVQPNEVDNMPDEEAYLLIFQAGLSTKDEITAVSGRGVGMDVVKSQLESLQGRINVKSTPGEGTEFHLIVPISLATIRGLIVRIGAEQYALPLHAVEKIININPQFIYQVEGNKMFDFSGEPMPIIHMGDVLERPRDADRADRLLAIILAGAERHMAFIVDDSVSEQEMVVKPLGKQLVRVRNVAGATLLGTGQPIVILNASDLIKSAQGGRTVRQPILVDRSADADQDVAPPRVLVVDDSITTRTLERNILQGAGYHVTTAVDGVEALALLETERFDLVVADIEMPRIDGFELVEWIRQSNVYGDIPVILVTSLESKAHRERGLKVGADAYIVKSGFEQSFLLETIEQFL